MAYRPAHRASRHPAMLSIGLVIVLLAGCGAQAAYPTIHRGSPEATASSATVGRSMPTVTASPGSTAATPHPAIPSSAPSPAPSSPASTAPVSISPTPGRSIAAPPSLDPPARPGRFAIDLYRRGDFVSQSTVEWCVPASILTMMNVIDDGQTPSKRPSQRALNRMSRSLSSPRLVGPGSEPEGWARTLNRLGYGRYRVVARQTRTAALATAARAIRLTGRPVGLLVWRGAHAWVMTGFEATADPAWTDDFRVTRVRVSDPWYPRATAAWGRPLRPDARMSAAGLARVLLRWRRPAVRYAELDGRYVLVLPVPGS